MYRPKSRGVEQPLDHLQPNGTHDPNPQKTSFQGEIALPDV